MPRLWLRKFGRYNNDCQLVSRLPGDVGNWLRKIYGDIMLGQPLTPDLGAA